MVAQLVETGKARFVSRHDAFLGENSFRAAEAAECASDQGKFWEYREAIYRNQAQLRGSTDPTILKTIAGQVGLNQAQFNACFDAGKYVSLVKEESQEAAIRKIPGTPAIYVEDRQVTGATGIPTADDIRAAVDLAVQKKGR